LALAAGCVSPQTGQRPPPPAPDSKAPTPRAATPPLSLELPLTPQDDGRPQTIGRSVEGRPIEARLFGRAGPAVLILGAIHGSEPASAALCRALIANLAPADYAGVRVVVVACANPDGLSRGRRENARGVDLNRNFAAANFRAVRHNGPNALCEPESQALQDLVLTLQPAVIVSIHQPLAVVDWDGPAEALARRMAALARLPCKRIGSRPGSLGSWAGEDLGIPIVTLELPRNAALSTSALWRAYGPALLEAIRWPATTR
ncbi:MAG TPA: DUF2817 domain-containing protein, partial [Candidatus Brocadiia bacterium]|nr:DUF2817 domain-containing protein [Candidatus Brocadiia bacterium]